MNVQVGLQISRACGISECKQKRDMLRKITDTVTVLAMGVIDDSTIDDICVGHAKHGTIDPFARQLQGADRLKEKGQRKCCPLFFGWKGD
jgi:hypothetical protein